MTLPTTTPQQNAHDDDMDIFGPPYTSPTQRRNRPKVPMISPQLRLRELRKRILQLCVHKLENIKDSERNLRRSVCINNTFSRLTEDIRREKQQKYEMLNNNYAKSDTSNDYEPDVQEQTSNKDENFNSKCKEDAENTNKGSNNAKSTPASSSVDADLETLDRELCALDAAMPLVDPEITQGAEQLEQAMVSRKRRTSEDENNDRLVREALSQFYLPSTRLISAIDDCPFIPSECKRQKTTDQDQKEFECIIDSLRSLNSGSNGTSHSHNYSMENYLHMVLPMHA